MKENLLFLLFIITLCASNRICAQGFNHQWLLGSYNFLQDPKGRMFIDSNSDSVVTEYRKMVFKGTQGNICDENGNFLMSSNGVWIANANNDTMLNGSGLNPNGITSNWPYGLPLMANNIFIPFPDDSNKYILFHHTITNFPLDAPALELYSSIVDITLDSGKGAVISKNNIVLQDTLNGGIGACKHANGRDWWIVMIKDSTDLIYKVLLTDSGVTSISSQSLNYLPKFNANIAQLTFSRDGTKFISTAYNNPTQQNSKLIICDFDRCTGNFSNTVAIQLINDDYLFGLAFSSSGKKIYACSNDFIFQLDASTLTVDTVAVYDGFISPPGSGCCATDFWNMYLAANGKIYVSSGSGVQHITVINNPDSTGLACNVHQHSIDLLNYRYLRAVPNHPNYYLGRLQGSPCDTLQWQGIQEAQHDFRFRVYPNPISNNSLHIGYLLPQNKSGLFQIINTTGQVVYQYNLPQWSNEQDLKLPQLANGIYNATIISDNRRVSKTIAIIKE